MELLNSKEVTELCRFSYRYLQMLLNNEIKKKEPIPHYCIVGQSFFYKTKWRLIPKKYSKSKVLYRRKEVIAWYNSNFDRVIV